VALLLRSEASCTADCAEAAAVIVGWQAAEDLGGKLRWEVWAGRGRVLWRAEIGLFAQTRTHGDGSSKIGCDGDRNFIFSYFFRI
jgi:hypothetical protein